MKALDYAKALGLAALVLVLDVLVAVGVVYAWSIFIDPGKTSAYYMTSGIPIALMSTRIFGTALIGLASWWSALRNPARNALLFAIVLVFCYAVLDGASVLFNGFLTVGTATTMVIKLIGAIIGAGIAVRMREKQMAGRPR